MGYFWWVRPPMLIAPIAIFLFVVYLSTDETITVETRPEQEWPRPYLQRYRETTDPPRAPINVESLDETTDTFESVFDLFQQALPRIRRSDYMTNGRPDLGKLNADWDRYRRQSTYMYDPAPGLVND